MRLMSLFFLALLVCSGVRSVFIQEDIIYPSVAPTNSYFGWSMAVSSDGTRLLVGSPGASTVGDQAGAAFVFDANPNDPNDWIEQAVLYPTNNATFRQEFGDSVAISSDGSRILVSAPEDDTRGLQAGAVFVFDVNPSNSSDWIERTILFPINGTGVGPEGVEFGRSVALSSDGTRVLVGAPFDDEVGVDAGAMTVFDVNPSDASDWTLQTMLFPSNGGWAPNYLYFGDSLALSSDGMRALVGAPGLNGFLGAIFVYDANPSNPSDWTEQAILFPFIPTSQPNFGCSVALTPDGSRALIGAYNDPTVQFSAGAAFVYDVNPSNPRDWPGQAVVYPRSGTGPARFGEAVAISSDGTRILVGADGDNTTGIAAGAAYAFDVNPMDASDWVEQAYLLPSGNESAFTSLGSSVVLTSYGTRAVVGAFGDDATSLNAGACYVYNGSCPLASAACIGGNETQSDGSSDDSSDDDDDDDDGIPLIGIIGIAFGGTALLFCICACCFVIPCLILLLVVYLALHYREQDEWQYNPSKRYDEDNAPEDGVDEDGDVYQMELSDFSSDE